MLIEILALTQSFLPTTQSAETPLNQALRSPVIESIEGDKVVLVRTAQGNRIGTVGTSLQIGNRVKTGPKGAVKIRFSDGSKLLIGRATEMEVQPPIDGVPTQELIAGEMRGIIRKPKPEAGAQPGAPAASTEKKAPPRFMVRTKAAVMGVRGTDFVYSAPEQKPAEVHTLQGTVEVAKDENTLLTGKGQMVQTNQFVQAKDGEVTAPQSFSREEYSKRLESAQPETSSLMKADPEIQSQVNYGSSARYELPVDSSEPRTLQLLNFDFGGRLIKQSSSSGQVITSAVSWSPLVAIGGPLWFRGQASFFPLKAKTNSGSQSFMGLSVAGHLSLFLGKAWHIEPGAGYEQWFSKGGGFSFGGQLGVQLSPNGFIERLFLSVKFSNLKIGSKSVDVQHFVGGIGFRL